MKLIKIATSFAVIAMLAGSSALAQGPGRGGPGGPGGPGQGGPGGGQPGGPGNGGGGFHPQPQPQPQPGRPGPGGPGGPVYGSPVTGVPVGPGNGGGGGFHPQPQPQPIPGPYRPQPGPAPYQPQPPFQPQPGRPGPGGPGGPVYGSPVTGYPVGGPPPYRPLPPGGPGYNNPPVFHFPTYPVYNNFPAGPCTIYANNAYNSFYTISNAYGQNIGSTYDYGQATQIAQNAVNSRQCSYVNTVTNNYSAPNYCQIEPGANAYGQSYYNVVASNGAILANTTDYQQALSDVQSNAQCYQ